MRCLHLLAWALLVSFFKTCPNLMAPGRRFECTRNSCRLVPEYVFDQQRARCLEVTGTLLSPVLALLNTSFAMRREKFHQDRSKMLLVYGSAVESLEELPEEQRKEAVPPVPMPCCHEPVMTCGNTNSQSQKHLTTKAPGFCSSWPPGSE